MIVPRVDEWDERTMTGRVCGEVRVGQQFPLQGREKTFRDRVDAPMRSLPIDVRVQAQRPVDESTQRHHDGSIPSRGQADR